MKDDKRKEFEKYLSLIGVRALTYEEHKRLNELMKEDGWAEEYYEHCHTQSLLMEKHKSLPNFTDIDNLLRKEERPKQQIKKFPTWIFAVAACLILAFFINYKPAPKYDSVAQVVSGLNYKLQNAYGQPVSIGDRLIGEYTLEEGLVELIYGEGVKVILEAPATFKAEDPELLAMTEGKVYAHTKDGDEGFTITTPKAVFNDLGTEFAIEAFDRKDTTLFVFKGKVQAISNEGDEKVLTAGQGLKLNNKGKILDMTVRDDYFVRTLPILQHDYQNQISSLSPVIYLPMEKDNSGKYYNYSAFSPGRIKTANAKSTKGYKGNAYQSTKEAYLHVPAYPKAAQNLSVSGWLKIPALSSGIIARNGDEKGQFTLELEQGILKAKMLNRHGVSTITALSSTLPANSWQHFAFVYDGNKMLLYHNGKLKAAKSNLEGIFTENLLPYLTIGSNKDDQMSFNGQLDEFAIFNKALSSDTVKVLYKGQEK
ncbi:MAG: FecR domain-containing protein [Lentisphaerales bacterium]|nr:FecR domain-containing protein [Lentisphaerales bacterium]